MDHDIPFHKPQKTYSVILMDNILPVMFSLTLLMIEMSLRSQRISVFAKPELLALIVLGDFVVSCEFC